MNTDMDSTGNTPHDPDTHATGTSTVFPTPRQRGMRALTLLNTDLSSLTPPETFLLGYITGWQNATTLCIQIENAINGDNQ